MFSATDVVWYIYLMYNGYVQTIQVLIRHEIMEVLSLQLSAILLPPIFYFSDFPMNIKAKWTFVSLLASDNGIQSKKLVEVLSSCSNLKRKYRLSLSGLMGMRNFLFSNMNVLYVYMYHVWCMCTTAFALLYIHGMKCMLMRRFLE